MDIHEVRQMLRYKTIYEIPLRVTYYARVSSDSDEQLNSLGIRKGEVYCMVGAGHIHTLRPRLNLDGQHCPAFFLPVVQ